MKKYIYIIVAFFALSSVSSVFSQIKGSVEEQNLLSNNTVTPQINIYVQQNIPFIPKLSWTGFSVNTQYWNEALVGLAYAPIKEVEIYASVGLEKDNKPFRYSWGFWAGKYNVSLFSVYEQGGSGYWYKDILIYNPKPFIGVGVHTQRGKGIGPRMELNFVGKFKVWGTYLIDDDKKSGFIGAKISF